MHPAIPLIGLAFVIDGDTLALGSTHVRLQGVAAPEVREAGGPESRDWLRRLLAGQPVVCEPDGTMTWGRVVAVCYVRGEDVAAKLVAAGHGRDCPRFSRGRYREVETAASQRLPLPGYCEVR
jgi:micrococcal nuclease